MKAPVNLALLLGAIAALLSSCDVRAEEIEGNGLKPTSYFLTLGGFSKHSKGEYNERHPGFGIGARWGETYSLEVGGFKNSFSRQTYYVLGQWLPVEIGWGFRLGLGVGLIHKGYRVCDRLPGDVCPVALPLLQWRHQSFPISAVMSGVPPIGGNAGLVAVVFRAEF